MTGRAMRMTERNIVFIAIESAQRGLRLVMQWTGREW